MALLDALLSACRRLTRPMIVIALVLFVAAPALDAVLCAGEQPAATATAALDAPDDSSQDSAGHAVCGHGHCHHAQVAHTAFCQGLPVAVAQAAPLPWRADPPQVGNLAAFPQRPPRA